MNNKKEITPMKGFRNYLLEKSGLDKLKIPTSLGLDDKEFNGQYLPLGKETKKISSLSVWATTRYLDQYMPTDAVESANVGAL